MTTTGGSLEQRIRTAYEGLSPSQKRLVKYLMEAHTAAAFSTARQLAEAVGVSEATVVRLAPALGYDGFPSLRADARARLASRLEPRPPLERAIDGFPRDPCLIMKQVLQNDIAALHNAVATVNPDDFRRVVDAVVKAKTVYLLGHRVYAAHALFAAIRLRMAKHGTRFLSNQFYDLPDQMFDIDKQDVLIVVSMVRYAIEAMRALRFARKRGAKTVVLTDDALSPPAKAADLVLVASSPSPNIFQSEVAPLSLLNALVGSVAVLTQDQTSRNIDVAYEAMSEFDLYDVVSSDSLSDDQRRIWRGIRES